MEKPASSLARFWASTLLLQTNRRPVMRYLVVLSLVCMVGCTNSRSHTKVEYTVYTVDGDKAFLGGQLCVHSNVSARYTVTNNLYPDDTFTSVSPPGDGIVFTNCRLFGAASITVTVHEVSDHPDTPPSAVVDLQAGVQARVFFYFADP